MSERSTIERLNDMHEYGTRCLEFVSGMTLESFQADTKTIFAVLRGLEVVGEAAKFIPTEIRELDPSIPWKLIAGMRDIVIHHYVKVNLSLIWQTVTDDLPGLLQKIALLIQKLTST